MTEKLNPTLAGEALPIPGQKLITFGPTSDDLRGVREMLGIMKDPESRIQELGARFSPRLQAEHAAMMIDDGYLITSLDPDKDLPNLDTISRLRVAWQRYIAGILGLRVAETKINPREWTAVTPVSLPDPDTLPAPPVRRAANGNFVLATGREIAGEAADAMFAAHYIAKNRQAYSQPGAFKEAFLGIIDQAEAGQLRVADEKDGTVGALALHRGIARVLGYEVGPFQKQTDGSWIMEIKGMRTGFDDKFTTLKTELKVRADSTHITES